MKEFTLSSANCSHLHCCLWLPEGEVRGVVQLVHGISEYVGRYAPLAEFLAAQGFAVVGNDHVGHGKSLTDGAVAGHFPNGWEAVVDDLALLHSHMRAQYPALPYFFYGHSMGSFLTRTYLYRYPDSGLAGVVLSGTAWHPKAELAAGRALCALFRLAGRGGKRSKLIESMMFGAYGKPFPEESSPNAWICSDPAVVARYDADPLCAYRPTVGMADAMLHGLQCNESGKNLRAMPKTTPILFLAGDRDPVGAMGKGVRRSAEAFRAAGMQQVTLRLYAGGRHEMHNEPNRDAVFADVLAFLQKNCN